MLGKFFIDPETFMDFYTEKPLPALSAVKYFYDSKPEELGKEAKKLFGTSPLAVQKHHNRLSSVLFKPKGEPLEEALRQFFYERVKEEGVKELEPWVAKELRRSLEHGKVPVVRYYSHKDPFSVRAGRGLIWFDVQKGADYINSFYFSTKADWLDFRKLLNPEGGFKAVEGRLPLEKAAIVDIPEKPMGGHTFALMDYFLPRKTIDKIMRQAFKGKGKGINYRRIDKLIADAMADKDLDMAVVTIKGIPSQVVVRKNSSLAKVLKDFVRAVPFAEKYQGFKKLVARIIPHVPPLVALPVLADLALTGKVRAEDVVEAVADFLLPTGVDRIGEEPPQGALEVLDNARRQKGRP